MLFPFVEAACFLRHQGTNKSAYLECLFEDALNILSNLFLILLVFLFPGLAMCVWEGCAFRLSIFTEVYLDYSVFITYLRKLMGFPKGSSRGFGQWRVVQSHCLVTTVLPLWGKLALNFNNPLWNKSDHLRVGGQRGAKLNMGNYQILLKSRWPDVSWILSSRWWCSVHPL